MLLQAIFTPFLIHLCDTATRINVKWENRDEMRIKFCNGESKHENENGNK
jgi:hypothetical protein